ncbi:MAG: RNase adaptor protein RapZ [Deltaproteobacteria bacterium RIFCSPLOWO2_02_FULL_46_8]|nr:MAG: RNase adaptor protein RapZ [Deltaproteobacteria bacterium RIFCSPLOWO2_02_FULL_46_8]
MTIVILTGYSGSGKTSALRYVESRGFYCIDNLPAEMLGHLIHLIEKKTDINKVAIVVDARGKDFLKNINSTLDHLEKKYDLKIIFFDSNLETVTKRFKEMRLPHPLAIKGTIRQGYETEKKLLASLRHRADLVIETSGISVHALKTLLDRCLKIKLGEHFEIQFLSFGYKYGVPQEADFVFDVRVLDNPYFEKSLKTKTGKHVSVAKYIFKDRSAKPFLKKIESFLRDSLKRQQKMGKPFVTIAFGCTGGHHRSVFVVEEMKKRFCRRYKKIKVFHRDLGME